MSGFVLGILIGVTVIIMVVLSVLVLVILDNVGVPLADIDPSYCPECNQLLGIYRGRVYYMGREVDKCPICEKPLRVDQQDKYVIASVEDS